MFSGGGYVRAEQISSAPPPLAEPLHWLTLTLAEPAAIQVMPTSVPPLAEPLHCVIVALSAVAGKGWQPVVMPPPEPTHWFTVAVPLPPLTRTEQRSVAPPPLADPLHCATSISASLKTVTVVVQLAVGSPAAP